jgi:hypothetical protein
LLGAKQRGRSRVLALGLAEQAHGTEAS